MLSRILDLLVCRPRAALPGLLALGIASFAHARSAQAYFFGQTPPPPGHVAVGPTPFAQTTGHGFESDPAALRAGPDGVGSDAPIRFSAAVPPGFYDVTVTFAAGPRPARVSVKSESNRLQLHALPIASDAALTRTFTVAVKTPRLASGRAIRLKPSQPAVNWDDKLTLEFHPDGRALASVAIAPATDTVGVFIAGDSTVCDQGGSVFAGWGQMLPRFFKPGVAVFNNAQSGDALFSFRGNGLLDQIWETARPGDYVLIQFGHNDQKDRRPGAGAATTYKDDLRGYVATARERGLRPVLVTPMERRRFRDGQPFTTLQDHAEAVRQVAAELDVPLIDLHASSLRLYAALGERGTSLAFVHYAAGAEAVRDNTHFSDYGAHQLARIVATAIHDLRLDLARQLADDFAPFDPARPDDIAALAIPRSPASRVAAPEGS